MRAVWGLVLAGVLALEGTAFARPAIYDRLEDRFGEASRPREKHACGFYLSPRGNLKHTDNTAGYRLAGLDPAELRHALEDLRDDVDDDREIRGDLSVAGLAMYDDLNREFLDEVRTTLGDVGLNAEQIRIIPMYQPRGQRWRDKFARVRALLPMRQDFQRPIPEEIKVGLPGVLLAEATTLLYSVLAFQPLVAIPMAAGHLSLLAVLTAYRRTISNWMGRSTSALQELTNNGLMSALFIGNYRLAQRWPQVLRGVQRDGLAQATRAAKPFAWSNLAAPTITNVAQSAFFFLTFNRGVYRYEALMATDPERSRRAQRMAAALTPLIFSISGPVLTWASTSSAVLARIGPVTINPGQAALAALALGGSVLAFNPRLLDYAVPLTDFLIYAPIARVNELWRALKLRVDAWLAPMPR